MLSAPSEHQALWSPPVPVQVNDGAILAAKNALDVGGILPVERTQPGGALQQVVIIGRQQGHAHRVRRAAARY
jgi:hypothetical protein